MKKKRTRACDFTASERQHIYERDRMRCIFCEARYRMEEVDSFGTEGLEIMHYIPRSQGGLGSRRNAALGCVGHHRMLDNGSKGYRPEMMEIFREYLKQFYFDWDERDLVFDKWKEIKP